MVTLYQIRHRKTGLYSKGGYNRPRWGKQGRVWSTLGQLKTLITQARKARSRSLTQLDDWEVVTYMVMAESAIPAKEFYPHISDEKT